MIAKSIHRILFISMIVIGVVWLAVPFIMAILWSLVDPSEPWTVDRVAPPVMSFYRWTYMWESSNLKSALFNSYLLAPTVSIITLILSIPTSYVFGRYNFYGKEVAKLLCLLPLVTPYFVLSIFLTAPAQAPPLLARPRHRRTRPAWQTRQQSRRQRAAVGPR